MTEADQLIKDLKMIEHPEGGYFVESYRNNFFSLIYYLLKKGQISHWHKLTKNETLHFYLGDPLILEISQDAKNIRSYKLGINNNFHKTIPSNSWFSMKSSGNFSLIGCTVAPPFNYDDFKLAPKNWILG